MANSPPTSKCIGRLTVVTGVFLHLALDVPLLRIVERPAQEHCGVGELTVPIQLKYYSWEIKSKQTNVNKQSHVKNGHFPKQREHRHVKCRLHAI